MTKILTHYDGDGIFSAAAVHLLFDGKLDEQNVFSTEFFSKDLIPVIKLINPDYILDLGNGFLTDDMHEFLSNVVVIDHHLPEYEKINENNHIIVPEAPSTGYLIYKTYEKKIESLDKKLKKWVLLFIYAATLSDVGTNHEDWQSIEEIFRSEIPFAFVTINDRYNFTYASTLSYQINLLKRFLYHEATRFAYKILQEVIKAEDLIILAKNLDPYEAAKYPATFALKKLIEQYKTIEQAAENYIISTFKFKIGYDSVRIIFYSNDWDLAPGFYRKYRNEEGIFFIINMKTRQVHARYMSSFPNENINLGKIMKLFKTIKGGGHVGAAGGYITETNISNILHDIIETFIEYFR